MAQIVARQEAVELREFVEDQFAIFAAALQHGAINPSAGGALFCQRFGQLDRHRLGIEDIAPQQHRPHTHNVIGGFAVDQRALPRGIGVNHPANGRAITGGKLRRKKIAVRFQKLIQLIFDHPRFHTHPPLFRVDLNDAVHIAGHINDNALVQRLPVGARPAAARGKYQGAETLLRRQAGDERHIGGRARENDGIGKKLVNTVIGRHRQPVGIIGGGITCKTLLLQCLQKIKHQLNDARCLRNLWDHCCRP